MANSRLFHARVFSGLLLSLVSAGLALPYIPAMGAPPQRSKVRLQLPKKRIANKSKVYSPPPVVTNTLLIMPHKGDTDDAMQKIREVNGTIVRTIGSGEMTTWVVQFESQEKFIKAEKELVNDKNFSKMQRDYIFKPQVLNDQYYASEYYIEHLNVEPAWAQSLGSANIIAVCDTGVNPKNVDLVGKLLAGFDCNKDAEKQKDTAGHGTMVSTTAAAIGNNFELTAGPARNSLVFPLNAYSKKLGYFPEDNLLEAIVQCGQRGIKILNMSLNADPPYTLANPAYNAVIQTYFQDYHDNHGGLVFNSAGNSGTEDPSPARLPYLIVVSATDESASLAWFSTWGKSVWFTAPGTNIACSSKSSTGKIVYVNGTSFSCPLTASIAALIWGAKPSLTNVQVEQKLITTVNAPVGGPNIYYGYGMPDASAAMYAALH